MSSIIALCDGNKFYSSCEQIFNPQFRCQPLIVVSNNDGMIVTLSPEAAALGLKKFTPYFQVAEFCTANRVVVCSSNYALYSQISSQFMKVASRECFSYFPYSIDEIFAEFWDDTPENLAQLGRKLRFDVWREVRLPIGVGLGDTLTLAKAANHAAKRLGYRGVCVIKSHNREAILGAMLTTDVWGGGKKLGQRLGSMGIHTALQLAQMNTKTARKIFGVNIERTVFELNGTKAFNWDDMPVNKRQIFSTRSVGQRITTIAGLKEALSFHACEAARKLRGQKSVARCLVFFAQTSPYDKHGVSGFCRTIHLPAPTSDSMLISQQITSAVESCYAAVPYYRVGVGLLDIEPGLQLDMFNDNQGNPALMSIMDRLNDQMGKGSVFIAANGIEKKWQMRRAFLSPSYLTNWNEIPTIHC
ncbi:Y-family DNA polymerase [Shewanella oncorhynchi]|uniref:Y-family DNA polymerase n=1 Tax=Shewanella oncorhynchi TaxID=2726434 RepID=UPI003D7A9030